MAKNKKGTGNPLLDMVAQMVGSLSPEQQMQLLDNMDAYLQSGKSMKDDRDSDALFYAECNRSRSKSKNKKGKQKYAFTLDITLKGSPRKVYRQLIVPSDMRLDYLGEVLVRAVGWDGFHLNQFIKGRECYLVPNDDNGLDWGEDARKYTIGDLLNKVGAKVVWEYDFGDSWEHEVKLVEKVLVDPSDEIHLNLVKGTGACPPEDCGGVPGYRHLLNVLKDPNHEEYEEMKEWLGSDFDPKKFNITVARALIGAFDKG